MQSKARNITIDIYKGVLILFVVLRHALQYSVSDEGGVLTNFIWAVQMPGFMLVSGFFAARKIESLKMLQKRILISAQSYLLPFMIWFVGIHVLILGNFDRNPIIGLSYIINHVDSALWFLWTVFVLSIVFNVLNFLLQKKNRIVLVFSFTVVFFGGIIILGKLLGFAFLGIQFIVVYAFYYGIGWIIKWTESWWKPLWNRISDTVVFISLICFVTVVFNFDIYRSTGVVSWVLRYLAGLSGNIVIFTICRKYSGYLVKAKLNKLGVYTLEIYVTHMCVNNLMEMGESFFTSAGLGNFICSLMLTAVFTAVIILTFKSIPLADYLFFGKRNSQRL